MFTRLVAGTAIVVLLALLAPVVLLSEPVSSVSIVVLGLVALIGGLALSRDDSRAVRRAGVGLAFLGVLVLAIGVGLFTLLSLGAFRGP